MQTTVASLRVERVLDACLNHHVAESEEHLLVLGHVLAQLREVVVDLFLLRVLVLDVQKVDPLEEVTLEALLKSSWASLVH